MLHAMCEDCLRCGVDVAVGHWPGDALQGNSEPPNARKQVQRAQQLLSHLPPLPSGKYRVAAGEEGNTDKRARWLIARDWIVCFLRAPWGSWTLGGATGRTLVYLYHNFDSELIDQRPEEFSTVVAYRAPALPVPAISDLADWACSLDPYLAVKGSTLAQEHLALAGRHPQPPRS